MTDTRNYRLRISEPRTLSRDSFCITYIVRKSDRVSYISADETPLALSNLILHDAAALRFDLEDAIDGNDAAKCVRNKLNTQWINNKDFMPTVEVLR